MTHDPSLPRPAPSAAVFAAGAAPVVVVDADVARAMLCGAGEGPRSPFVSHVLSALCVSAALITLATVVIGPRAHHGRCPQEDARRASSDVALDAAARADAVRVARGLERYRHERGAYPSEQRGLQELVEPVRGRAVVGDIRLLEDPWGHGFVYSLAHEDGVAPHRAARYELVSRGADGVLGTDDDVAFVGGAR